MESKYLVNDKTYSYVPMSEIESQRSRFSRIAAHCMIFARTDAKILHRTPAKAWILILLRHDGKLGFPGGFINKNEPTEIGLARELREEINLDIGAENHQKNLQHFCSVIDSKANFGLHFYGLEMSETEFLAMEKNALNSEHYGIETMGINRVPLAILPKNRGFSSFLGQNFAACSKAELLHGINCMKIMTETEIDSCLH